MTGLGGQETVGEGPGRRCACRVGSSHGLSREEQLGPAWKVSVPSAGWSSDGQTCLRFPRHPQDPLAPHQAPTSVHRGLSCHGHTAEAQQNKAALGPDPESLPDVLDPPPLSLSFLLSLCERTFPWEDGFEDCM